MIRGILCVGGFLLVAVAALLIGLQKTGRVDVLAVFSPLPEIDEPFQRGFRSDVMANINGVREPLGPERVRGDDALQAFVNEFVAQHPDPENLSLEVVFNTVQERFPGAQYLAANLVTASGRENLVSRISGWNAVANPDFNVVNTAVFESKHGIGALSLLSRRIPLFSLKEVNQDGGRFYNKCPHCGEVHALELNKNSRTIILSCPYCDLPFDVLASDTADTIRRATDFFEGFDLERGNPALALMSEEERILNIWRKVADQCEYQLDQEFGDVREVWKRPSETWTEKAGDCEDTAILLADALITAGFEARVAIGWNGNIGQHAWVAVKTKSGEYILESTLQKDLGVDDLAGVDMASAFYQPEQLFDQDHLYYTTARQEDFTKDYFSDSLWKLIPKKTGKEALISKGGSGRTAEKQTMVGTLENRQYGVSAN